MLLGLLTVLWTPAVAASVPAWVAAAQEDPLAPVDAAEMMLLSAEVEDARATATARLSSLADVQARTEAIDDIERQLRTYDEYVSHHVEAVFFEDKLVAIRARVTAHLNELETMREQMAEDLAETKRIGSRWSALRRAWGDGPLGQVLSPAERNELRKTIGHIRAEIRAVGKSAEQTRQVLVDLQARAQAVYVGVRAIDERLQAATAAVRSGWAERHSPAIWAHDHSDDAPRADTFADRLMHVDEEFFERSRGGLVLHALALVCVIAVASRLRSSADDEVTRSLFQRYISLAAFCTGLVFAQLYQPMPPLLDAALWAAVGIGGFRLATAAFGTLDLHRVGAGLALAYPVVRVVDILAPSTLALRWTLVLTAALGAIGLGWRVWRGSRDGAQQRWRVALGIGAVALLVSSVSEALGFTALARPAFGATIRTGFVVVVFVAGRRVARGVASGLSAWLEQIVADRWRETIRGWARNLGWLLEGALLVGALLDVLYAWRLVPSPVEAFVAARDAKLGVLGLQISLAHVGLAAITLYVARQISRVIELSLDASILSRAGIAEGTGNSIKTLVRYVLLAFGGLVALGVLGIEPQSIAIVAGALGVGIGFGLQSVVADLTSGIILLFEGSLRAGDAVIIDGRWGQVRHIGLRSTVVTMIDQSELVCPNSSLTSEKIENWTLTSRRARVFCPVGIAYGSDVELAFRTLLEVAAAEPDALDDPAPEVLFLQFGDSSLGLELRVWTDAGDARIQLRSKLLRAIDTAFRRVGVEIAFPQRDLHVRTISPGALASLGSSGNEGD